MAQDSNLPATPAATSGFQLGTLPLGQPSTNADMGASAGPLIQLRSVPWKGTAGIEPTMTGKHRPASRKVQDSNLRTADAVTSV
jgi:hypothetical protein